MSQILAFFYGVISYLVFFGSFLYAIGFVGNLVVPKSIDSGNSEAFFPSLLVNLGLLGLFAIQHSTMARPAFKAWWTKIVPQPIERSTYVLLSSLIFLLLFWQWRPMTEVIWQVDHPTGSLILRGLFGLGWLTVLVSTFLIDHFALFGLRQVILFLLNKEDKTSAFKTPGLYQFIRHPIMLGFIIAFWATPVMTVGHLLFALTTTIYVFIAIQLEERDLLGHFGEAYQQYQKQTGQLLPRLIK
jgi:methanethiol S-methyltransferase